MVGRTERWAGVTETASAPNEDGEGRLLPKRGDRRPAPPELSRPRPLVALLKRLFVYLAPPERHELRVHLEPTYTHAVTRRPGLLARSGCLLFSIHVCVAAERHPGPGRQLSSLNEGGLTRQRQFGLDSQTAADLQPSPMGPGPSPPPLSLSPKHCSSLATPI